MGKPFKEIWPENYNITGPMFEEYVFSIKKIEILFFSIIDTKF